MRNGYVIGIKAGNGKFTYKTLRTRATGFVDIEYDTLIKELINDKDSIKSMMVAAHKSSIEEMEKA